PRLVGAAAAGQPLGPGVDHLSGVERHQPPEVFHVKHHSPRVNRRAAVPYPLGTAARPPGRLPPRKAAPATATVFPLSVGSRPGGTDQSVGRRSTRRRSCALSATMIVDRLMRTAPTAGASTKPTGARTPEANGTAMTLYPAAHTKF